jgi:hypothetical protein
MQQKSGKKNCPIEQHAHILCLISMQNGFGRKKTLEL